MAAPCSEDIKIRRKALPSVRPKPRSSGSATTVAWRIGSLPGLTSSCVGLINSAQFLWIMRPSIPVCLHVQKADARGFKITDRGRANSTTPSRLVKSYTRRRFGGRQPLCAIGVTSRIDVTLKPAAARARSADSRPEPGP